MRTKLIAIFIIIFAGLCSTVPTYADKTLTINDECIYLDELTAPQVPHNKVMCGIKPGEVKFFPKEVIQNHLNRAGIKATVVAGVTVQREGEKLSETDISDYVAAMYAKAYPDLKISVEQMRMPKDLYAEKQSDFSINIDTGKFGVNYAEVNNGHKRSQVHVYIRAFKDSWVTTERVKLGDVISTKARRELVDITSMRMQPVDSVEGLIASKAISQGRAITPDSVQAQPALKKGEKVKLVYNDGLIRIETVGIVEENAFVGKLVPVRNIASQKIIAAEYTGNGIATASF